MPRNILLFMTDQQRTDYVGYAADSCVSTPNIDWIAQHAHFTCCNTTNPICSPARTSLITGRYPRQIGTLTMAGDLFPQIPTFMQALQGAGYKTYGIGKFHYNQTYPWSTPRGCGMDPVAGEQDEKSYGYDFIWETAGKQQVVSNYCFYGDYLAKKGMLEQVRDFFSQSGGKNGDVGNHNYDKALPWPFDEEDYIDVVTGRVAREQLRAHPAELPFYMMVSFCGPHKPYDAPQRYLDMFPLEREDDFILPEGQIISDEDKESLYRQRRSAKAMIRLIDDQIGATLDVLRERGMLDDTLIVFTSDHGDMLGDHFMKACRGSSRLVFRWRCVCRVQRLLVKAPHRLKFPTLQQLHSIMQDWMHSGCSAEAGRRITILFRAVHCCRCCVGNKSASVIFALAKATLPRSVSTAFPSLQHHIGAAQTAAEAMRGRLSSPRTASTSNISAISWMRCRMRNSTT